MRKLFIFNFLIVLSLHIQAQNELHTPPKGSMERKILLDLVRSMVEKDLGIEIIFEVRILRVQGNYAFGELVPRQKNGQSIDYTKTNLDPDELSAFDDWFCVLWQQERSGNWSVREAILGATDLPYGCWWKTYSAPKTIFTYTEPEVNCGQ